jgi:hypothetical protein
VLARVDLQGPVAGLVRCETTRDGYMTSLESLA